MLDEDVRDPDRQSASSGTPRSTSLGHEVKAARARLERQLALDPHRWDATRGPAAERLDQPGADVRIEILLADDADRSDRALELGHVLAALRAGGQVLLEPDPVALGQRALEVIGDHLDEFLAWHLGQRRVHAFVSEVVLERLPHLGSRPMKEHPLIRLADPQLVTHLLRAPALHVPQDDGGALVRGQAVDRPEDELAHLARQQPLVRLRAPDRGRDGPVPRCPLGVRGDERSGSTAASSSSAPASDEKGRSGPRACRASSRCWRGSGRSRS